MSTENIFYRLTIVIILVDRVKIGAIQSWGELVLIPGASSFSIIFFIVLLAYNFSVL